MTIAAVVLTHNRNELLAQCLDSIIIKQSTVPDEVVLVNSGSSDIRAVVERYDRYKIPIKTVVTSNESLADNRNAGVMASAADIIAFTDDDCEVCPEWIDGYLKAFAAHKNAGSIGGMTLDATANTLAHGMEEVSMMLEDYYNRISSPGCYFFSTRNVCYNKRALEGVGFFEGTYRRSFEDVITGIKIKNAGYENVYCPEITVRHYGRTTIGRLIKRQFDYGRDMRAGSRRFADMPSAYILKALRSPVYILLSTFVGPFRDALRFGANRSPLKVLACSFLLKASVNAGMIYERMAERCA